MGKYYIDNNGKIRKKKKSNGPAVFLLILGILLEAFAGGLYAYNEKIQRDAEAAAEAALEEFNAGYGDYIGVLSIDALGIKLPVIRGWDNDKLNVSLCQFDGDVNDNNLIIIGHNFVNMFGKLENLKGGEQVMFTSSEGITYSYSVSEITEVSGDDPKTMYAGDWDLTLYTCNYSGAGRITIRCVKN